MPFKRHWDSSCPREWLRWEAGGTTWVVADLPPQDDEAALDLLERNLIEDETFGAACNLIEDAESVQGSIDYWRLGLQERTTLACYELRDGTRNLAGLNVLCIRDKDQVEGYEVNGKKWQLVYKGLEYLENQCDVFEYFGLNRVMKEMGLCVDRHHRGKGLGGKILEARESFAKHFGIKASSTVFTGPTSQKLAERCGYRVVAASTLADMARDGLDFPSEEKVIKYMVKRFE